MQFTINLCNSSRYYYLIILSNIHGNGLILKYTVK